MKRCWNEPSHVVFRVESLITFQYGTYLAMAFSICWVNRSDRPIPSVFSFVPYNPYAFSVIPYIVRAISRIPSSFLAPFLPICKLKYHFVSNEYERKALYSLNWPWSDEFFAFSSNIRTIDSKLSFFSVKSFLSSSNASSISSNFCGTKHQN